MRMRVDGSIGVHDIIQMDGEYTLFVERIVEKNREEEGGRISENNFLCPIRNERR